MHATPWTNPRPTPHGRRRIPAATLLLAGALLAATPPAAAVPTVNGLFHGDGDSGEYVYWDTSYYGSDLYVQYDAGTSTLYVALVVDRSVNDNVFTGSGDSNSYMASAGWGNGGGQQRSAAKLIDSEFATFQFACEPGTSEEWVWQQGYACRDSGGAWVSDETCGASAVVLNGFPPSLQSASSFAWNLNTYEAKPYPGGVSWDLYYSGTATSDFKSPPGGSATTVIGQEGYPAASNSSDLSDGPNIGYSSTHEWEWAMVYEWSLDLGPSGANCGNEPLFLVTGQSHHSPMKEGTGAGANQYEPECGEENDCFPDDDPGEPGSPLSDWGDLPDSYGTTAAAGGPRHYVVSNGPYLGSSLDIDADGNPSSDASGDNTGGTDDENGITPAQDGLWDAFSVQSVTLELNNVTPSLVVGAWFDWNNDGDFDDADEFVSFGGFASGDGAYTRSFTVGAAFDPETDDLHARFRVFSDATIAPGGSLTADDYLGTAVDGEVEDYRWPAGFLPVELAAFSSRWGPGGALEVEWQTASEAANVGFEVWGEVDGVWRPLGDIVPSRQNSSALPETYRATVRPAGRLTAVQLVDHDTRGRTDGYGPFEPGTSHGEQMPVRRIDWEPVRHEREARLTARGFVPAGGPGPASPRAGAPLGAPTGDPGPPASDRWRRLSTGPSAGTPSLVRLDLPGADRAAQEALEAETGAATRVAVTADGIQRVTHDDLLAAGLDLTGVPLSSIAVTLRGEPVARWIGAQPERSASATFTPRHRIEWVGRAPAGEDALYVGEDLYRISVDPAAVRKARTFGGRAAVRHPSPDRETESVRDRPLIHHRQSPTGDPWIEKIQLVTSPKTVALQLPVDGPVAAGPARLFVTLGTITDLPDLVDAAGQPIPEHMVSVWFGREGSTLEQVASSTASGQREWTIEADLPAGSVTEGTHRIELRFRTDYLYSLVVVDRYGITHRAPYTGPRLDFAADADSDGYRIGNAGAGDGAAYLVAENGDLLRWRPRPALDGSVELALPRGLLRRFGEASRIWVDATPHRPAVFTTAAPDRDLFERPADLLVLTGPSFVGSDPLDRWTADRRHHAPLVVDLEDVYNAFGHGMALPSAITDFLRFRSQRLPFEQVQLVGADCTDRRNFVSDCVSFVPLPSAPVGVTLYSPSHNRLLDLDGDGVADAPVAQFSVRTVAELETIVRKGEAWEDGLRGEPSALLIAEESDGSHSFATQISRIRADLGWSDVEVLDLAAHPSIATARQALADSLAAGRALTMFSGHSSPTLWATRGLLTPATAGGLGNDGLPTLMVPLACETTWDVSPSADVLGHQLLYGGDHGAVAIVGAASLSSQAENELLARHVVAGLQRGLGLGEALHAGREAVGGSFPTLQDNWMIQGDVTLRWSR